MVEENENEEEAKELQSRSIQDYMKSKHKQKIRYVEKILSNWTAKIKNEIEMQEVLEDMGVADHTKQTDIDFPEEDILEQLSPGKALRHYKRSEQLSRK